jgi:hypothetical protein
MPVYDFARAPSYQRAVDILAALTPAGWTLVSAYPVGVREVMLWLVADQAPPQATGATAGTPGFFTPAGAQPVASLEAMRAGIGGGDGLPGAAYTPDPESVWPVGTHVVTADGLPCYWDGAGWEPGFAP